MNFIKRLCLFKKLTLVKKSIIDGKSVFYAGRRFTGCTSENYDKQLEELEFIINRQIYTYKVGREYYNHSYFIQSTAEDCVSNSILHKDNGLQPFYVLYASSDGNFKNVINISENCAELRKCLDCEIQPNGKSFCNITANTKRTIFNAIVALMDILEKATGKYAVIVGWTLKKDVADEFLNFKYSKDLSEEKLVKCLGIAVKYSDSLYIRILRDLFGTSFGLDNNTCRQVIARMYRATEKSTASRICIEDDCDITAHKSSIYKTFEWKMLEQQQAIGKSINSFEYGNLVRLRKEKFPNDYDFPEKFSIYRDRYILDTVLKPETSFAGLDFSRETQFKTIILAKKLDLLCHIVSKKRSNQKTASEKTDAVERNYSDELQKDGTWLSADEMAKKAVEYNNILNQKLEERRNKEEEKRRKEKERLRKEEELREAIEQAAYEAEQERLRNRTPEEIEADRRAELKSLEMELQHLLAIRATTFDRDEIKRLDWEIYDLRNKIMSYY